jgi:hypothetical protein
MENAMKSIGFAALGLSLIATTAASAQTTVTREVSDMPVETTIIRSPTGTTVTRRVLPAENEAIVVPAPSGRSVTTTVRPSRQMAQPRTTTRVTRSRNPAPVYAMATAEPVVLDNAQRDVVYRRIVEQRTVPVEQRGILAPVGSMFPMVEPVRPTVTYAQPLRTTYVVGSRLPADIQLVELPETVIEQVPSIAPYAYAMVDGRVLLVDPQSGIIVSDLTTY